MFFGYPLIASVYLSFTHYDLLSHPRWVGTANYSFMLHHDPQIWNAVKNTLWLMAFAVPLQVLFAFGVAAMIVRAKAGVGFFRTVFYLPTLAPPVAATLGFTYILNPATGPVNTILGWFGITGPLNAEQRRLHGRRRTNASELNLLNLNSQIVLRTEIRQTFQR